MYATHRRPLMALVLGAVLLVIAVGLIWAAFPDLQPVLLVGGLVATAVVYAVLYLLERRRHW